MAQCSFDEEIDLHDGYRATICMNSADILETDDPCYGLCYRCAYNKLKKILKEIEDEST